MLRRNVPILIDSLLDATCNFQFKFARASCKCRFSFFLYKTSVSKKEEIIALWSTVYQQIQRNKQEVEFKSPNWESRLKIQICSASYGLR